MRNDTLEVDGVAQTIEEALRNREIVAISQLGDTVNRISLDLRDILKTQQAMILQLEIFKAADFASILKEHGMRIRALEDMSGRVKTVDEHAMRIRALEDAAQQRKGAVGLMGWIASNWQFLTLLAGGIIVYLRGEIR